MVLWEDEDYLGRRRRPKMYLSFFFTAAEAVPDGMPEAPIFFFLIETPPTAAVSQMGAEGVTILEDEGNAAKGRCFASIIKMT